MPRRKARLIAVAASAAVAASLAVTGGAPPARAIAGGSNATPGDAPYQVGIYALTWTGKVYACGGFLRDANTVVTAAHCLDGRGAASLFVLLGGTDRTRLPREPGVSAVLMYPGYNPETLSGDVGLLKLATPVMESNGVRFVPLAASDPAPGTQMTVTGWGRTSSTSTRLPRQLQLLQESADTTAGCTAEYGGLNLDLGGDEGGPLNGLTPVLDPASMLCGKPAGPGQGLCRGDAGDPAVVNGAVVGIASWGATGCGNGTDEVYSSVAHYRTWLSQNI